MRRRTWGTAALVIGAAGLLILSPAACAQKNGMAFWEPDPQRVDAVLRVVPKPDALRYDFLRRSFANFECTAKLMNEQAAGKHNARNLVCTLPGQTSETIFVLARFDDRGKLSPSWTDAVMLPILYHALQAQPRYYTFVFVALDGYQGEKVFFQRLHQESQPRPALAFVLDNLGFGNPRLILKQPKHNSARNSSDASTLAMMRDEGTKTAQLMNIPDPSGVRMFPYIDSMVVGQQYEQVAGSTLVRQASQSLEAIVYSEFGTAANSLTGKSAFHDDFDFLAWYLCEIDAKLPLAGQTSQH
jgi:hypothetical protein